MLMRYLTKTTLNARLGSSETVNIYIPAGEEIETASEQNDVTVKLTWRGQALCAESSAVKSTSVPAK